MLYNVINILEEAIRNGDVNKVSNIIRDHDIH